MIGRSHRFHGRGSLKYVYRQGQTVRGGMLSLRFSANGRRKDYRVAVIVSRKVHRSAVVRNRIRRRIYEVVRQIDLGGVAYDIVITAFSDRLATISADELQQCVSDLYAQAKLAKGAAEA